MWAILFGGVRGRDPFLKDCLLVMLDACENDSHTHVRQDKYDTAEGRERGAFVRNGDANVRTLRRGVEHVEEASSNAEVTGFGDEFCVGGEFSYFRFCDEWVPWSVTAL